MSAKIICVVVPVVTVLDQSSPYSFVLKHAYYMNILPIHHMNGFLNISPLVTEFQLSHFQHWMPQPCHMGSLLI